LSRTIAWFSCGVASAVAAKVTLKSTPDAVVARCLVANELPDNARFAADVAQWLGVAVVNLRSEKYADCWEVWEKRRYLNGPKGALCTVEMKKKVRQAFEDLEDVQVFGYTVEEKARADRFIANNPEVNVKFPLIEQGMTKRDCHAIVSAAGLVPPLMYRMGYHNANCVGCVKGGAGYWNKIRVDFPEVFARMADLEERIGASCIKGKPLRTLPTDAGRHTDLELPDCGLFCGQNEGERDA
jgi:hypothetical protein